MYKKLLFIFITIAFTCSALEIEIGGAKQTFCDEYDTYIPSKPLTVDKTQVSKAKKPKLLKKVEFKNLFFGYNSSYKINLKSSKLEYRPYPTSTIFLQKTELRI